MNKFFKSAVRNMLKMISPEWEQRIVDQFHFNQLGRKPPEFWWQTLPQAREAKLDCGGIQVGDKLYIFGGLLSGGDVLRFVDIFDLQRNQWIDRLKMPEGMAESHVGMMSDGDRFIYCIAGQLGKHCSPATSHNFIFDTTTKGWLSLPPLPKPRYAPTVQYWRGRLHVIGGSKEDRNEPSVNHWSLAVEGSNALENEWREEIPIPRGGPHRASAILNDGLYVFGGQEGDYIAIPGDSTFKCTGDLTCEVVYPDVYKLEAGAESWKRMADMPVPSSHTENSMIRLGDKIIILGGQKYKDPQTRFIDLTDVVQMYDANTDAWKILGHLPYYTKSAVAGFYQDYIYFTTGQRNREDGSPRTGPYDNRTWRAKFKEW